MRQNGPDSVRTTWILFATACAAGAVDIIGFAKLGGVFASAMTGNFALLAYHVAILRGTDVDQPRNLAKSVTVE